MKRKEDIQVPQESETDEQRFVSDTQRIVRRHLENEDDEITHEDIANVRVGMTPPLDNATEDAVSDAEEKAADRKTAGDEDVPGGQKASPWDVLEDE
jgi:hypothetical protein